MSGADGTPPARPNRLMEAKRIFLEIESMGLTHREEVLARACAGDEELRSLVRLLLDGADAPLPFESLADDIRAANELPTPAMKAIDAARAITTSVRTDGEASWVGRAVGVVGDGDRIGNYHLLERLGEGGFGVVFMAEQERPIRRRVALKIIKLGMDTRQVVARFEAERQALALMDHPNIAKVFDAGATETGRPYFVMELVRGSPITEFCDRQKLSIRQRLELMSHVCGALQHAHQKGIIHRDIKPSNVLVEGMGEEGIAGSRDQGIKLGRDSLLDPSMPRPPASLDPFRVKIIDFGIAKATSARLTEKTIFTEFRQMIGTPEYMSPEQAGESNEDVDTRTDVYSAGVLLYELLTGSTPFDSKRLRSAAFGEMQRIIREEDPPRPSTKLRSHAETLAAVATARATPPAKLPSAIRGELDWIVMKALEKDRSRRYDSAGSMARDLQRYLAGEAVQAAPPSRTYAARKFVRRNKAPVGAASLLALTLIAGLVGTSVGFFRADEQRREAIKEKRRADDQSAEAIAQRQHAQWQAYLANMGAAMTALRAGESVSARVRLLACSPNLRGWEWSYAMSRLDTSVRSFDDVRYPGLVPFSVDLAPDGRTFVTPFREPGANRWGARIADVVSGETRTLLLGGHTDQLKSTRFSPDGTRVVTASMDGSARLYDARDGREIAVLHTGDVPVIMASFDLLGRRILCCPELGQPIRVFDATSLEPIAALPDANPYSAYLVPGSDRAVVTQGFDPPLVWEWTSSPSSTTEGHLLRPISNYTTMSNFAVPAPDGKRVATTVPGEGIRLVDISTGRIEASMRGNTGPVMGMAFTADGSLLASASLDGTVRVWDTATGNPRRLFLGHSGYVWAVVFSPDGSTLYSAGTDGVRVWHVRPDDDAEYLSTLAGTSVESICYSPDGKHLLTAEPHGGVRLYDVRTHDLIRVIDPSATFHARYSADGRRVVTARYSETVHVWDAASWEQVAVTPRIPGGVSSLAVNADATRIAVSSWEHQGTLYDGAAALITVLPGFDHWSGAMAFTPDGTELIVDAHRNHLRRWNARDGAAMPDLPIEARSLHSIDFADGAMLLSHEDGRATLWEWPAGSGKLVHQFLGHGAPARGASFLPGSPARIVTAARDGTIRVWDRVTGDEVAVIHTQRPFPQNVAVHPDGVEIVTTFEDKDAQFFRCVASRDRFAPSNSSATPIR